MDQKKAGSNSQNLERQKKRDSAPKSEQSYDNEEKGGPLSVHENSNDCAKGEEISKHGREYQSRCAPGCVAKEMEISQNVTN